MDRHGRARRSLSLPRSGECSSVAEDTERRLVITESALLDKFVVDTDRLSASGNKTKQINGVKKGQKVGRKSEATPF